MGYFYTNVILYLFYFTPLFTTKFLFLHQYFWFFTPKILFLHQFILVPLGFEPEPKINYKLRSGSLTTTPSGLKKIPLGVLVERLTRIREVACSNLF